jgi:hypothetical protein
MKFMSEQTSLSSALNLMLLRFDMKFISGQNTAGIFREPAQVGTDMRFMPLAPS